MSLVVLGIGNILEKDDGIGVYASAYLDANYTLSDHVRIMNGGVEGINLLNVFLENDHVVILDTIHLDDEAGSIYNIPSYELRRYGVNSGGAHEVGVLECLDMIELMGYPLPTSNVIGIVPKSITFEMGLSDELMGRFAVYVDLLIGYLEECGIDVIKHESVKTLREIMDGFKYPSH